SRSWHSKASTLRRTLSSVATAPIRSAYGRRFERFSTGLVSGRRIEDFLHFAERLRRNSQLSSNGTKSLDRSPSKYFGSLGLTSKSRRCPGLLRSSSEGFS